MRRREAIKSIALASTATIFLTGCSDKNVVEFLAEGRLVLNQKHTDYLAAICETILPISGISDKIGEPVRFLLTMLNDTALPEDIIRYAEGFEQYKLLMNENRLKIKKSEPGEVIKVIETALEAEEPQEQLLHFINTTKAATVYNLTSSEYFMVEHRDYKMIPDEYMACIEI